MSDTTLPEFEMDFAIKVDDLPPADFARFQQVFGADEPICPHCALETLRQMLMGFATTAPDADMSMPVRSALVDLAMLATAALVNIRVEVEAKHDAAAMRHSTRH